MKKVLPIILFIIMTCTLGFRGVSAETVSSEQVHFVLHNLLFQNQEEAAAYQQEGSYDAGQGLQGVTFQVYDVTARFLEKYQRNSDVEKIQAALAAEGSKDSQLVAEGTTDETGVVNYYLPAKNLQLTKDAVYLFTAVDKPVLQKEQAENMVVVLPIIDEAGQAMKTINLYSKNIAQAFPDPNVSKKILHQKESYQSGDVVEYQLTATIPEDISTYQFYRIEDQADDALKLLTSQVEIQLADSGGAILAESQTTNANGFSLSFSPTELSKYSGRTLKITYKMKLGLADQIELDNTAKLVTSSGTFSSSVDITTGGKQFEKVDVFDQRKKLAGAKFILLNQQNQVLTQTADGYAWQAQASGNQMVLTSDSQGVFSILGLAYGQYYLKEIQAPANYRLNEEKISFEVKKGSYNKAQPTPLKVVNQPLLADNLKKTFQNLMQAGEHTNWFLTAAGLLVITGLILLIYKRAKNQREGK